ncbi:hypothetical protein SLEP1_g3498 [Rubroshorea leprosula]|uniref:SIS domain-containing protein n=1 Tax=Rubroshorea leprosula TaxID=152421 RepID=A0AAV5HPY0_9ROSI|nr:hypothetical protein SLEP1_g3498 [Rubroshorea leprosula]
MLATLAICTLRPTGPISLGHVMSVRRNNHFIPEASLLGPIKKHVLVRECRRRVPLALLNPEMDAGNVSMSDLASQICNQIASIFAKPTSPYPPALDLILTELTTVASRKGRVFLYGVGREGLMLKALCMRLFHLGLSAHFVFDMTTPPISSNDLFVASAGPGGFSTVDALCSVARSQGARVLLLTAQPKSGSSVKHASVVAYLPAQTMADDAANSEEGEGGEIGRALLPMGSVYEGAMFVLFEMVIFKLGEVLRENPEDVRARHTNLE